MDKKWTVDEHIIPKFLLRFFKDENGNLYCLFKEYGSMGIRSVDKVCYKEDAYEIKISSDVYLERNHIENNLSVRETKYKPLCEKIISICDNPDNKFALIFERNDKELLAEFVINLHTRNLDRLSYYLDESYSELKDNDKYLKEIEELKTLFPNEPIDAIEELALTKEIVLPVNGGSLAYFKQKLLEGSFCIIKSNENNFIISDNIAGCSLDNFIVIPISPRYAIMASFDKCMKTDSKHNRLIDIDERVVLEIDKQLYQSANEYIFGRKDTLNKIKMEI